MEVKYQKLEDEQLNEQGTNLLDQLVELSSEWAEENCTVSYDKNTKEYYLNKELFIAVIDHKIIAYALGTIKVLDEKSSYNEIGEKAFELDEIYVSKHYRNQKIGNNLFKFVEASVKEYVDVIGLIATSVDYKKLLRFYIDELDLVFNHALLVKRTKN